MSKLVFGVTKLVSERDESVVADDVFREALDQLRQACPRGVLRINLSVEADSAEEVGAVFESSEKAEMK